MVQKLTQSDSWRLEYRSNRYLRDLKTDDLLARAGHFLTNVFVHSGDGRVTVRPVDPVGDSSGIQRYTHVLEEMATRGLAYSDSKIIQTMNVPRPKSPKVIRALQTLAGRKWPESIIVKFGKRKYMAELLLEGRGRISLARFYDDESLGHARADDESRISAFLDPADSHRFMATQLDSNGSVGLNIDVPYLGSVPIQVQANTDFYVYCMAESVDIRLFDDFSDADACIVITHPDEFKKRIQKAISMQLPGWKFIAGPVIYFDPFFCHVHQLVPHFWKDFRFGYQKEHRLAWLPPTPSEPPRIEKFEHIWFEVGPLTDCAKLVWL